MVTLHRQRVAATLLHCMLGAWGCGAKSSEGPAGADGDRAGSQSDDSSPTLSGEALCEGVTACGGDVVGTWVVAASCLPVSSEVDVKDFGFGCESAPVTGALDLQGTWTAKPDGKYADDTTTSGQLQIELASECLDISGLRTLCSRIAAPLGSLGFSSVTCVEADGGGCSCDAVIEQSGSLLAVSFDASTSGRYSTTGNVITMASERSEAEYDYCVSGNTLGMSLLGHQRFGSLGGAVVFNKQ